MREKSMPTNTIYDRTLPNGLQLILREAHDAPVASFWVWYRVGSRNELPGLTGVSHWVEHMQFKGTPNIEKGAIFRDVSKNGGVLNAMTSNDWTAYFETLPSNKLNLAIGIEADRMSNSLFDPEETESERTVILSERQGAQNQPTYQLYEELVGAAFRVHPYRHMVIGHEHDLKTISRDDLYGHYRQAYNPANAFITAVGDFNAEELAQRIEDAFGGIETGAKLPPVRAVEPPQTDERRVLLYRPAPTAYLRMGFKTPEGKHPDNAALLVADAVLSGGKPMGLGGGGPMGRSARLYRSLVAAGLARAAGSDIEMPIDPYMLIIGVTALPGVKPAAIETVVDRELERLASEPVPAQELERALKQVKAQYVYSAEGVTNQAFWLGQMEIVDSYKRADSVVEEIEAVTAADVQRVAATYLKKSNRTVGWLLPSTDGGGSSEQSNHPAVIPVRWWGLSGPSAARAPFERTELSNGIVVLGQAQPEDAAVSTKIRIEAGASLDPAELPGLAAFTARSILRGTADRTFEQFNEATDNLGASVSVDAGRSFTEVSIRSLREDLPALLDLVAAALRQPIFPEEEIEKVRNEILTTIQEQNNDTRSAADLHLRKLLYPEGHPFRHRTLGELGSIPTIRQSDLIGFHRRRYGPKLATFAVVGGIADFNYAVSLIEERFGDWHPDVPPVNPVLPPAGIKAASAKVGIAGKSQADLAIGAHTIARTDPAYYALDLGNLILGRLGLMGRLGANVRDKQGLAYYSYSSVESGKFGSLWVARAGVDPSNIDKAKQGIVEELERIRTEPVTDEELADGKSFTVGSMPIALETNDGIAATLLSIEAYGLGLDYVDRYPELINSVSVSDITAALSAHLDPSALAVSVAGPA
jgi:zinc protease